MPIHNNTLIVECSIYNAKEMKIKLWSKYMSYFINANSCSLFYVVNDDDIIVGLKDLQTEANSVDEMITAKLDSVSKIQFIPLEQENQTLLEIKILSSQKSYIVKERGT